MRYDPHRHRTPDAQRRIDQRRRDAIKVLAFIVGIMLLGGLVEFIASAVSLWWAIAVVVGSALVVLYGAANYERILSEPGPGLYDDGDEGGLDAET